MPVSLKVTTNAKDVARRIGARGRNMKSQLVRANWDMARFAQAKARSYAPVESGYLKSSIIITRVTNTGFTVEAVAPYAKFQEAGTNPSKRFGFVPMHGFGRYGQGFMEVRGFRRHPGVRPRRFMARAREDTRRAVRTVYSSKIRTALRSV